MSIQGEKPSGSSYQANGRGMQRLQFELALDMTTGGRNPSQAAIRTAADTAGADLLLVLPAPGGLTAVLRLNEDGTHSFLQVATSEAGLTISEEAEMNEHLLGLARASVDVLERMSTDRAIREPLAVY